MLGPKVEDDVIEQLFGGHNLLEKLPEDLGPVAEKVVVEERVGDEDQEEDHRQVPQLKQWLTLIPGYFLLSPTECVTTVSQNLVINA
jgi:hypothetical protein